MWDNSKDKALVEVKLKMTESLDWLEYEFVEENTDKTIIINLIRP